MTLVARLPARPFLRRTFGLTFFLFRGRSRFTVPSTALNMFASYIVEVLRRAINVADDVHQITAEPGFRAAREFDFFAEAVFIGKHDVTLFAGVIHIFDVRVDAL